MRILIVEDEMKPEALAVLRNEHDITLVTTLWDAVMCLGHDGDFSHIILDMNFPTDINHWHPVKAVDDLPGETHKLRFELQFAILLLAAKMSGGWPKKGNGVAFMLLKSNSVGTFFSDAARRIPVTIFTHDFDHSYGSLNHLVEVGEISSEARDEIKVNTETFCISSDGTLATGRKDSTGNWLELLKQISAC